MTMSTRRLLPRAVTTAVVAVLAALVPVSPAHAAEEARASLSDLRPGASVIDGTLIVRGTTTLTVDTAGVKATVGGQDAQVTLKPAAAKARTTMLVIDTSGSMENSGMATVRAAVRDFLAAVPKDVKVGVVSFASTAGVDVKPTTNRAAVQRAVDNLRSRGETALYQGVQVAVKALGTSGERSIVLLSDGGDTVEDIKGGNAREASQLKAAVNALTKAKVRAEVVAFNSPESNGGVLRQFATAGGGSVVTATNREAVASAFNAAARALESQVTISVRRPAGLTGVQPVVVTGTASGRPFTAEAELDLGAAAPVVEVNEDEQVVTAPGVISSEPLPSPPLGVFLPVAMGVIFLGMFLLVITGFAPAFRSARKERVSTIEAYGIGGRARVAKAEKSASAGVTQSLVDAGEKVMSGRESTSRTMALIDRADLPWRAGEWFVIRILSVLVGGLIGYVLLASRSMWVGLVLGIVLGYVFPAVALRFLARRRANAFEFVLPDVLMLTATSLASGFSLLQALDAVARDAPQPASKEFSRALAETRIGADVSDALEHMAERMDSANMRWATMAIRIQREVGGNLAETLRTTAATLREREGLRRHVKALSAEGRLSAYILIALPFGLLFYSMWTNYEYVSLLWNSLFGFAMLGAGSVAMIIGIFWMRNVVKIEV
ncbi:VWA domain-containing protein [Oryzobacter sp. R7]|uniref:VWA domain-containing protein n=1 Tax=Oryzobacter faecalis TaxID=3388656 RepID=UPI00398D3AE2